MIWSGVKKFLVKQVQEQGNAIEFQNFAVFGPVFETNQDDSQSQQRRTAANPILLVLNQNFVDQSGAQIDSKSDKAVGAYDYHDKKEVSEIFQNKVQSLNTSAIAKVCLTDNATVEVMLKELWNQLCKEIKDGYSVRVHFKIGVFLSKNGLIQFQQCQQIRPYKQTDTESEIANSYLPISVVTPSVVRSSFNKTEIGFHYPSNPNTLHLESRYKSIRELAKDKTLTQEQKKQLAMLKFGRRVVLGQNTQETIKEHLSIIHDNLQQEKINRQKRIEEEKLLVQKLKSKMESEEEYKQAVKDQIKKEFISINEDKKRFEEQQRLQDQAGKASEKFDYFPFVHGEQVENGRKILKEQLNYDMSSTMHSRAKEFAYKTTSTFKSHSQTPNNKWLNEGLDRASSRLSQSKGSSYKVKAIFDSDYKRPSDNFRVIQDFDPVKQVVLNEARKRYEFNIQQEKNRNEMYRKLHEEQVQMIEKEDHVKIEKQKSLGMELKNCLQQQISDWVSQSVKFQAEKKTSNLEFTKTGFGPIDTESVYQMKLKQKRKQLVDAQSEQRSQIQEKISQRLKQRQDRITAEERQIQANNEYLERQKLIKYEIKRENKMEATQQLERAFLDKSAKLEAALHKSKIMI